MIADNQPEQPEPINTGGEGGDTYLTPTQENKILATALNPRNRFRLKRRQIQEAIDATVRNMKDEDGRVSNGAVANLIKMVAINQKDEHHNDERDNPKAPYTLNIQNNGGTVSVDDGRSELAAICAAALERARGGAGPGDSNGHSSNGHNGTNGSQPS